MTRLISGLLLIAIFMATTPSKAEGFSPLFGPKLGCFDRATFGLSLFDTGTASTTVYASGPVLDAYIEWSAKSSDTNVTSTLTINGSNVAGIKPAGAAAYDLVERDYFNNATGLLEQRVENYTTWSADIGPNGSGLITQTGNTSINITQSTGAVDFFYGATITLVFDTSPCTELDQLQHQVGIDFSYFGHDYYQFDSDQHTELLVFDVPNVAGDRVAKLSFSHGGTDQNFAASCRGRAIWMKAGRGAKPNAVLTELVLPAGGSNHTNPGQGVNGGVEIVNDPFSGGNAACTLRLNPSPDYPYETGHPYPAGAGVGTNQAPYYALSASPASGANDGSRWGVIDVEINIPGGSDWLAFQLESEGDTYGEQGIWAGSASLLIQDVIPAKGALRVSKNLSGHGNGYDPAFTIDVTCDLGGISETLVLKNGQSQTVTDIPGGARCALNERALPSAEVGYKWLPHTYSPAQTVVVVANQTTNATVNNVVAVDVSSLEVRKTLVSDLPSYDPDFTIDVSCNEGTTATIIIKAGASGTVNNIPVNAECTVTEAVLPAPPADRQFASPAYNPAQTITIASQSIGGTPNTANLTINSDDAGQPDFVIPLVGIQASSNTNVITVSNVLTLNTNASITIINNAAPTSSASFSYTATGVNSNNFSLEGNGAQQSFNNLNTGNYSFTGIPTSGWHLSSLACQGAISSNIVITDAVVNIALAANENIVCHYQQTAYCSNPSAEFPNVVRVSSDSPETNDGNNQDMVCVGIGGGGSVEVTQVLTGQPSDYNPDFTIDLSCTDGSQKTMLLASGESAVIERISADSECTVTESGFPAPPKGYIFIAEAYTPASTVAIVDGTIASVNVVNTLERKVVDVSIVKSASSEDALSGQTYSYTLTAKNNGRYQATGVYALDPIDLRLSYVCDNSSTSGAMVLCDGYSRNSTEYDPLTGRWTIGDLDVDETVVLNIVVRVN